MKVASVVTLLYFFVLKVFADNTEDTPSFKYTAQNFNDEVSKKHHFIMFYAPWCGHCKSFSPTWEQLAEMLNEDDSNIRIAKVDCTSDAKVCSEQDITGYPTLKFFKVGDNEGVRFRGTRDLPTITNFINEQLRQGDEDHPDIRKEFSLKELTDDNFDSVIESGKAFVKFYAPWCGHCQRLAPTWLALAKAMEFNEEITIAKIDCTEYRDVCTTFDVKGYPTMLWFENGQKVDKYSGERSLEDLKNYVNKMAGSKIKLNLPGLDDVKFLDDDAVLDLSSENFNEEIQDGITFVDFFSPWCGHCKRLAPTWEQLGRKLQNTQGIKIAKVDCTSPENREFCNQQELRDFHRYFFTKMDKKCHSTMATVS